MKVKLDENLSRHLKPRLQALRYDVLTAADEGLLSQSDVAIAKAAKQEDRILLTLDLEFADLRKHPPGTHPGIVLFRPQSFGPLAVNAFVESFMKTIDRSLLLKSVLIAEPTRLRIRRP
ncbi:MAG: DUF5615 family PIN-like protein [Deltaproteobacteria bacterium]|nr:DUF5615 family PIN-like protein [Deltaproteobacteria bacterium]